ncbi:MAG: late control protein, partial [Paenibacillus macerans]|nr:late control protein [Paenibacillus macerans]
MKTVDARRAELELSYNGYDLSIDIAKYLIDFSYNDAPSGELDDLQITIQDRDNKWQTPEWMPLPGDSLKAAIRIRHWDKPGTAQKLSLGDFEVDSVELSGPPSVVQIKGVSLGIRSNIRQEKRSKAWEKVTLRSIAGEIAQRAGYKLVYSAPVNPTYDRLDQSEQSDLEFLLQQCKSEGVALKVTDKQLVLFDEFEYEKKAPVATYTIGKDKVLSYTFGFSLSYAAYVACEISYTSGKKTIKTKYVPPGAPSVGPVLKISEKVSSQAEALRKARNAIREKNKEMGRSNLSIVGEIRMAAG